nr:ribonuclease H-like domain-containing protein [Tanacetum cinerariifolium]
MIKDIGTVVALGGKITGKGIIKTGKLEFENVYFVKELKYNPFSVSQICDNKNSVLFTDSKCLVLGKDFKLNDDNHLEKFNAKGDEGYFVGYSPSSKAFRVFNKRTKKVEENLHLDFLENKLIEKGAGTSSTNILGTKDVASQAVKKDVSSLRYIALLNWFHEAHIETSNSDAQDDSQKEHDCNADVPESNRISNPTATLKVPSADQLEPVVSLTIGSKILTFMEADLSNMETSIPVIPTPTFRIHKDHPKTQIIGPVDTPV